MKAPRRLGEIRLPPGRLPDLFEISTPRRRRRTGGHFPDAENTKGAKSANPLGVWTSRPFVRHGNEEEEERSLAAYRLNASVTSFSAGVCVVSVVVSFTVNCK